MQKSTVRRLQSVQHCMLVTHARGLPDSIPEGRLHGYLADSHGSGDVHSYELALELQPLTVPALAFHYGGQPGTNS